MIQRNGRICVTKAMLGTGQPGTNALPGLCREETGGVEFVRDYS